VKHEQIKHLNEGEYVPAEYWEKRLEGLFNLQGVGHLGFNETYNKWYYRLNKKALAAAVSRNSIRTSGARLLDIGIGTGYYIDFWSKRGVGEITGIDLTRKSVSALKSLYPSLDFHQADISQPLRLDIGKFDIILLLNVLYHVIGEEGFATAIANAASILAPGGAILIIDNFLSSDNSLKGHHEEHRTMAEYEVALEAQGLGFVDLVPVSFVMNTPLNASCLASPLARSVALRGFRFEPAGRRWPQKAWEAWRLADRRMGSHRLQLRPRRTATCKRRAWPAAGGHQGSGLTVPCPARQRITCDSRSCPRGWCGERPGEDAT
jgi:SAM-dependent methyltransferase